MEARPGAAPGYTALQAGHCAGYVARRKLVGWEGLAPPIEDLITSWA
jgi:hypothetical protein